MGGGEGVDHGAFLSYFVVKKTNVFLFWIETLYNCHDLGSIKQGYLFCLYSDIMVRTHALFSKFYVAWLILPSPPSVEYK